MDWRSPSLQSTPDWKIKSQSAAVTPERSPQPLPPQQLQQQQQPKPGIVRTTSLSSAALRHAQLAQQASPSLMATPREVKVVLGNKAIMGDEGIPIAKPVDDYMRDMEVSPRGLPCTCAVAPATPCLGASMHSEAYLGKPVDGGLPSKRHGAHAHAFKRIPAVRAL